MSDFDNLIDTMNFDADGHIPAISQDYRTKDVLICGHMSRESLRLTLETGKVHYFSRSRKKIWLKGETSGNFQYVKQIRRDCENNSLLIIVEQSGPACHTGAATCFFNSLDGKPADESVFTFKQSAVLERLYAKLLDRRDNPKEGSYTNYLFDKGVDKILKKVGEESAEVIIASKNSAKDEIVYEIADLMYHLSVLMIDRGVKWDDIFNELTGREKE